MANSPAPPKGSASPPKFMAPTYEGAFGQPTLDTAALLQNAEMGASTQMSGDGTNEQQQQGVPGGVCACLSVRYYQPYFDVDTAQVKDRILYALFPFRKEQTFIQTITANPDAYGPFWIGTTLIFVIGVISNWNSWWHTAATYDFQRVVTCAALIYGFLAAIPAIMWLVLRYITLPLPMIQALCIYGYSLVAFIPYTLIAGIPLNAVAWASVIFAGAASSLFLLKALGPTLLEKAPAQAVPLLGGVAALQMGLALTIKLLFFKD